MGISNQIPNSRIAQAGVCTSTTRPAAPYEGQMIYETDTNNTLVYNGSAWVCITPQMSANADFSTTSTAFSNTSSAVTLQTGTSALVHIVSSRNYNSGGATNVMAFAVSGATTRAALESESAYWNGSVYNSISLLVKVTNLTAGSNTFTIAIRRSGGTAYFENASICVVGLP